MPWKNCELIYCRAFQQMKLENQAHPRTEYNSDIFSALFVSYRRLLTTVADTFALPANKSKKGEMFVTDYKPGCVL